MTSHARTACRAWKRPRYRGSRMKRCERCKGDMSLDKAESEWCCLQCGVRVAYHPGDVGDGDPYEQLVDIVSRALEIVQKIARRADTRVAADRRAATAR